MGWSVIGVFPCLFLDFFSNAILTESCKPDKNQINILLDNFAITV